MALFNRTLFYEKETIDNILENDLVRNHFDLFKIKRPTTFFTVSRSYIQRPDLLSLKLYGNTQYWWIVARFNQIDDFWNDLNVGDVIRVPNKEDIEDWYLEVKASLNRG